MSKTYLNPSSLFGSQQYGFSQIVSATSGTTVYISGQVGWDAQQQIGEHGDFAAQTTRAFANLRTAIEAAGGTMDDIVSLRIYIVGAHIHTGGRTVSDALHAAFKPDQLPTSNWIGVAALANPDFLIEVEAIAVIENA